MIEEMYRLDYTYEARADFIRLKRNEPKAFKKLSNLLVELMEHPTTGTGKPERLKGKPEGRWSRRITDKHRLVYRIYEETVVVLVLSSYGHYEDK